jgi:muconate cycloisomerase
VKIERIETLGVSLPERRAHPMAFAHGKQGDYVIVKIFAEGLVGLGEATVLKAWGGDHGRYYGEDPALTISLISDVLAPALIGEDAFQIERLMKKLDRIVKGYPYAKASIDIALHDLIGKAYGVPVYQLLGGLYRREVPLVHSLGIMEKEPLLHEAEVAASEGVRTIKLKAGLDPHRDVEIVRAVRELLGDEFNLSVDANQGWPDPKTAIQVIKRMEPYNLLFVEQPVEGLENMARVAHSVDTHIMADESAWNAHDILEIAKIGAAEIISLYVTKPGGLRGACNAAAVAEAAGFSCNVNGSAETGVGNAANLHLAAARGVISQACALPVSAPAEALPTQMTGRYYLDDIISEPFEYRDGSLIVSDRPGLGVELDDEKVAKYRRFFKTSTGEV